MQDAAALAAWMERSLEKVVGDVGRARSLVRDAMSKLFDSFGHLRDHLAEERVLYEDAIHAISGNGADQGLVSIVREVLTRFVGDLQRLSESSSRILGEVEALRGHADEVATRGHRIEKIAHTTRVISLNARIEAQRVGSAGAVFRVVADEIKALAGESGDLSKAIRHAIEQQARSLSETRKAADQLATADLGVIVDSHAQLDGMIAQLARVSRTSTEALVRIQADVDAAIQALQFEDMLTQLLAAVSDKLESIRGACSTVARGKTLDLDGVERVVRRDAVTQSAVEAGGVELF